MSSSDMRENDMTPQAAQQIQNVMQKGAADDGSSRTVSLNNESNEKHSTPPSNNNRGGKHVTTKDATRIDSSEKHHIDDSDKIELTEEDCYDELGFSFPFWKKWTILSIIFLVQVSMNLNTSLYSNGLVGISEEFGVSEQAARAGAMIFLVT